MDRRNQKIIDAIIEKANRDCPGSLAIIGIYGSYLTGDIHEKSDLDLMILINDDRGWQLACTFIQDDLQVGHDLYCTTWESLENDARFTHPNISKLMDSKIVYCADEAYRKRLESLRSQALDTLRKPFSQDDFAKAEILLKEAEHHFTRTILSEEQAGILVHVGHVFHYIENAIAMLNKTYFRYGTKRIFEELEAMSHRPEDLRRQVEAVLSAATIQEQKQRLSTLMKDTVRVFEDAQAALPAAKQKATSNSISGTYEEMFSNWRNKMYLAIDRGYLHLSFMSMYALYDMLCDISGQVEIGSYPVLNHFVPDNLLLTAKNYDRILEEYRTEYEKAGIYVKHYRDIDTFIEEYLKNETA